MTFVQNEMHVLTYELDDNDTKTLIKYLIDNGITTKEEIMNEEVNERDVLDAISMLKDNGDIDILEDDDDTDYVDECYLDDYSDMRLIAEEM